MALTILPQDEFLVHGPNAVDDESNAVFMSAISPASYQAIKTAFMLGKR